MLKIWIEWKREYQLYRQEDGKRRLKKKRQKMRGNVGGSVTNKIGNNKEKKSKKWDRMSWK